MNLIAWSIAVPFAAGLACLLMRRRAGGACGPLAVAASAVTAALGLALFLRRPAECAIRGRLLFLEDSLNGFILLAGVFFGLLITIYSLKFMAGRKRLNEYYCYILWTIGAAVAAILANDFIVLLIFWGILAVTMYLLISLGEKGAEGAAKKAFLIVGGSDALMMLGLAIVWSLAGSGAIRSIADGHRIALDGLLPNLAFLCLAAGAFAKAGGMPFHTWIPDMAKPAPTTVTAFLPGSLDKLLGIYLLARVARDIFIFDRSMGILIMALGSITIIGGVMMALVQHDMKRLLSYHAVSQAGYMILGIGTGIPIGIAGGLFHMLNNAIFKYGLFLSAGAVEYREKTTDLDRLGGLAKVMPITFITCLVASLAISGIPPFNGFFSKWMVYQGIVEAGSRATGFAGRLWVVWLLAAMFGSALTLASFMKLLHAVFLGQPSRRVAAEGKRDDVPAAMWVPMAVLATLCAIFGIFAYAVPLKWFILPAVPGEIFIGFWAPGLAAVMIVLGIFLGAIVYLAGKVKGFRVDESYIGGETLPPGNRISGVDFYNTIKELDGLKWFYVKAAEKRFDIYDQGRRLVLSMSGWISRMHSGILPAYLAWCIIGMIILLFVLVKL